MYIYYRVIFYSPCSLLPAPCSLLPAISKCTINFAQVLNKGFQFLKNNAQRDIKAILGKSFQFLKIASDIHPKKVNILTLEQFGELTFHVAFKGNEVAKAILKASVTTTVERLAVTLIDDQGFEPLTAVKEAGNRLL